MIAIPCRARIAAAALLAVLLSSRAADAQHGLYDAYGGGSTSLLGTGVGYDIVNQAKAERRLGFLQGKLERDEMRGNVAAAERDAHRMRYVSQRIAADEWLIRKNSLQDPGCYPYPPCIDPMTCAAIAQYRRPPQAFYRR